MNYGNQTSIQLPINQYGIKTWALVYDPPTGAKIPLIFMLHGIGEVGSTEEDLKKLCNTGLTQMLADGLKPGCIVISPQASDWSYDVQALKYMLPEVLKMYSNVDQTRIWIFGLSAGGSGAWSCATDDEFASKIAGIIPLSAATRFDPSKLVGVIKKNNLAIWAICGTADSYSFQMPNAGYVKMLNDAGIPARLTLIKDAGHDPSAWNVPMREDFAANINNSYKESVWKFILNNPKNNTIMAKTLRVEAEDYSNMFGVALENAFGDPQGGGKNVAYIDPGDWVEYNVNIPEIGLYKVDLRIAAAKDNCKLRIGGVLVSLPNTGGYQIWQTVSTQLQLSAGIQKIRITAETGNWNINWFELSLLSATVAEDKYTGVKGSVIAGGKTFYYAVFETSGMQIIDKIKFDSI